MGAKIKITKNVPSKLQMLTFTNKMFLVPASLATKEIADAYAGLLKDAIYRERFKQDLAPLSDAYLKDKIKNSFDPRHFVRKGFFVEHIQVVEKKRGQDGEWGYAVGFPSGLKVPGTQLTVNQLARILEHGNSRTPARPIFQKTGNMFFTTVLHRNGYIKKKILAKIPKASRHFGRWPSKVTTLKAPVGGPKALKGVIR